MRRVEELLKSAGFEIDESSEALCQASRQGGDYATHRVTASLQDIGGLKLFVTGYLLIKEVIGEEADWTSVGREIGPKGMYPASSHCAGGWPIDQLSDSISAIEVHLLAWLEKYGKTSNLIEMIEDLYFDGERIPMAPKRTGLAKSLLRELGVRKDEGETYDVIFRPSSAMYLANLYYGIGNNERALFFLERWIESRGPGAVDPAYIETRARLRQQSK